MKQNRNITLIIYFTIALSAATPTKTNAVLKQADPETEKNAPQNNTWAVRPLPDLIGSSLSIAQADDGGFVFAGSRDTPDGTCEKGDYCWKDIYIFKLDPAGNKVWEFTYGNSRNDTCNSVIKTLDGGFIAACHTGLDDPLPDDDRTLYLDILVIKLNASGKLEWKRTYNNGIHINRSYDIFLAPGGGYIICGFSVASDESRADAWIFKIDGSGDMLWSKSLGDKDANAALKANILPDGRILVAGDTSSFDSENLVLWFLWLDSEGSEIKSKSVTLEKFASLAISSTQDGGFVTAGAYDAEHLRGSHSALILRFDSDGNELWRKKVAEGKIKYINAVDITDDGSAVVAGTITTKPENDPACYVTRLYCQYYWLAKFDEKGELVFEKKFGSGVKESSAALAVIKNHGYIVAGSTLAFARKYETYEIQIMRLDENGECRNCF